MEKSETGRDTIPMIGREDRYMISIKNLKKVYKTTQQTIKAVDSLTLDIEEGEIFGVIGYSGAGKSTFVRLLNRLENPTDGKVFIDGKEMTSLKPSELRLARQEIGMIFQHFNLLWSRTTKENISFPLEVAGVPRVEREKKVQELIDLVGLSGRENSYPAQLSGGQKQRVGIARALANNPKVLLCDEATSALDPETTNAILDLLVSINQKLGLTIVMITHEMHVIRKICDQVAVMEAGNIVEQGRVIDVFSQPKEPVTKKFVEQLMSNDEDDDSMDFVLEQVKEGFIVQLHFVGEATNDTLISEIAKNYPVDVNILQGKITQTQNGALGTMMIQMLGDRTSMLEAITYMKSTSVGVEVIREND